MYLRCIFHVLVTIRSGGCDIDVKRNYSVLVRPSSEGTDICGIAPHLLQGLFSIHGSIL